MKNLIITGSNGFLGSNLARYFSQSPDYKVFLTSQSPSINPDTDNFIQADVLDAVSVNKMFSKVRPDIIINTVSLVNVDQCEQNPALAHRITIDTAGIIALAADRCRSRVVYISSDQLFDGTGSMYTEDEPTRPVNVYGETKCIAELITRRNNSAALIIRTNFFGWSPVGHIPTFGEWVYTNIRDKKPMNLFTDFYFTPIEVTYFSEALDKIIIASPFGGIINVAGSQRCSKYEFGMCLGNTLSDMGICEFDPNLITAATLDMATLKAQRPKDMSLSTDKFRKLFKMKPPALKESIERFCKTMPVR